MKEATEKQCLKCRKIFPLDSPDSYLQNCPNCGKYYGYRLRLKEVWKPK